MMDPADKDTRPHPGDRSLRIAKWHLDEIAVHSDRTIDAGNLRTELADAVTVFAAASIEERLNTFVRTPLLFVTEIGPRRFLAKLLTEFMRLSGPQKIKFLREQVPALKDNTILKKVLDLCQRRNRILHTSLEYSEVKALPDQPYVPGLHDHLPESAFVQRPALTTHRQFGNPLEQAAEDYQTACSFDDLMLGVVPFEPWPPSGLTDEN